MYLTRNSFFYAAYLFSVCRGILEWGKYKEYKLGFSAQELQKIYPELVKEGNDGYLSIDGTGLIAPLVEAIKEQQAMIESQQKEINELKNIINNLK